MPVETVESGDAPFWTPPPSLYISVVGAGDQVSLHLFHKVTLVISGSSTTQELITPQRPPQHIT